MFKKITLLILAFVFCSRIQICHGIEGLSCRSALLMDYDTGKVLYKHNPHEKLPLASVTKIMTLLITMEEIKNGNLKYDDIVVASSNAKGMGGSTIFLDEGEKITVEDLLKGIVVSSGNDACVAIAEHICGNEDTFVQRMNTRAFELGMKNTNFTNCNGLDEENHYSSAYDISLMSRELMKHKKIFDFSTIWLDSLRNGEFILSNTNKLIRYYEGATGLKTGSTAKAGFCISATAQRNGMHLIAVILNAPTSKQRTSDATTLLNYGFSNYKTETVIKKNQLLPDIKISKGKSNYLKISSNKEIKLINTKNTEKNYEIKYEIPKSLEAPITKGEIVGKVCCIVDSKIVDMSSVVAEENVEEIDFLYSYGKIFDAWLGNN